MDIGLPGSHTLDLKATVPTVAFLARLDPIKRPWLYVELARRLPDVMFLMAGSAYTPNKLGFSLDNLPPNLNYTKFTSGTAKQGSIFHPPLFFAFLSLTHTFSLSLSLTPPVKILWLLTRHT